MNKTLEQVQQELDEVQAAIASQQQEQQRYNQLANARLTELIVKRERLNGQLELLQPEPEK